MAQPPKIAGRMRQTLPPGTVAGRAGGRGSTQIITIPELARSIGATGLVRSGGGGGATGLSPIPDGDVLANISGGSAIPVGVALSAMLDYVFGNAQGDILYRDAAAWKALAPGASGKFLETLGAGANPTWATPAATPLPTIGSGDLLGNAAAGSSIAIDTTLTALIDRALGSAQGDILYRDAAAWKVLAPGTSGYFLKTLGAAANPLWAAVATGLAITEGGTWSGAGAYTAGVVVTFQGQRFVAINNIAAPSGGGASSWNPADKDASIVLSNANLTATQSSVGSTFRSVRGLDSLASGKYYFEVTASLISSGPGFIAGIGVAAASLTSYPGSTATTGNGMQSNGNQYGGTGAAGSITYVAGNVLGIAVDLTNKLVWWRNATTAPSTWKGSGAGSDSPVTGVAGHSFSNFSSTTVFPMWAGYDGSAGGDAAILNTAGTGATPFTAAAPTGFSAWGGSLGVANNDPTVDTTDWVLLGPPYLIGQVPGSAGVDTPNAGSVGEYIQSIILVGAAVALTTGVPANVTSIVLTPGDWDVFGTVWFSEGGGTLATEQNAAISATSATLPSVPGLGTAINKTESANPAGTGSILPVGPTRVRTSLNFTIYLIAQATFTVSTDAAYGIIRARRMR